MSLYSVASANKTKSFLLLLLFPVIIVAIVQLIALTLDPGAGVGMGIVAFVISLIYAFTSYFWGDQIVLKMNDARPITEENNKRVYRMVENLCIAAGIPMPKVYSIPDTSLNAFATGRSPKFASIAITDGALAKLADDELEGVLAHELSHVKNYDTLVLALTIVMVNVIQLLGEWFFRMSTHATRDSDSAKGAIPIILIALVTYLLGGLIAILVQQAISRKREYLADASAALLTRYPQGLANALKKIGGDARIEHIDGKRTFASLYIANPLASGWFSKLFSTHPPLEKRIQILENMGDLSSV